MSLLGQIAIGQELNGTRGRGDNKSTLLRHFSVNGRETGRALCTGTWKVKRGFWFYSLVVFKKEKDKL